MADKLRVRWGDPGRIERLSIIRGLEAARQYASGVMLDVGCGDASYRAIFETRIDCYIGADYIAGPNRSVQVLADAQALPFASRSVDTILSTQVLDELEAPDRFFGECLRVLRPGGYLICTVPFFWRTMDGAIGDYYRFTSKGLRMLSARAGLQVVSITPRGGFWATGGQMASLYLATLIGRRGPARMASSLVSGLVQSLALLAESIHHDYRQTLGYVLVARRPKDDDQ
jgi:SAM-dependent methyltransferase